MKKRVLLLAVSCREGGLCPGGIDLENESQWIRIVRDDGRGGSVQGVDIDFARPLDIIEFDGRPMPQGKQQENWVIDNHSCKNLGRAKLKNGNNTDKGILDYAYKKYSYNGFWGNYKAFLNEKEFEEINQPSESIMRVSNVHIYEDDNGKSKIDFDWSGARYRIKWISMTDQDYYGKDVTFDNAYIVISIPKETNFYVNEQRAYKFVSRVFGW
jgi:hypothetical protein